MGIPLGHKLKIVKKIKDIRGSKGLTTPQSREGTNRKLNNHTEVTTNHSSSMSQIQPKSSLKEGHFDEKESHGQFLEALHEWRTGNSAMKDPKQTNTSVKKVRFNDNPQIEESKTSPPQKKGIIIQRNRPPP